MEEIIVVKNLSKSFQKRKILTDITFQVAKGEICGIIGRNGSGKSVLFKCMVGLIRHDAGNILIEGEEIKVGRGTQGKVGIVIEGPGFLPEKNGYQNLKILAQISGENSKERICQTLEKVGLKGEEKKKVGKYSMGMKQRLAIAQAIMEAPDILLLDEPMNNLDEDGVEEIRKLLLLLKEEGKTILLSSHNREDIEVLCDRVYRLQGGQLKEIGKDG